MNERWLPVPGFEGQYEVSDFGSVRSLPRIIRSGATGTRMIAGQSLAPRWLRGYAHYALIVDGVRRHFSAHRLVLSAFVGPCPDGMEGCHNDGVRSNNSLSNLRWDTRSANALDMVAHGTHPMASRTHCPQGHPYDEENTKVRIVGRGCRRCERESRRRRAAA